VQGHPLQHSLHRRRLDQSLHGNIRNELQLREEDPSDVGREERRYDGRERLSLVWGVGSRFQLGGLDQVGSPSRGRKVAWVGVVVHCMSRRGRGDWGGTRKHQDSSVILESNGTHLAGLAMTLLVERVLEMDELASFGSMVVPRRRRSPVSSILDPSSNEQYPHVSTQTWSSQQPMKLLFASVAVLEAGRRRGRVRGRYGEKSGESRLQRQRTRDGCPRCIKCRCEH
jgi:hypothetical protein